MYINSIEDAYYILTAVSSSIILLLSFLLVRLQLPAVNEFLSFRLARKYLSVSYVILGLAGILSCMSSPEHTSSLSLFLTTASVASFQSLLFTVVHMLLMEPNSINKHLLKNQFLLLAAVNALVFAIFFINVISVIVVALIALILYLLLQGYYIVKFKNICNTKKKFVGVYYDDHQKARLKTIIISFYASFTVGILSLISSVLGLSFYIVFIIMYTLYYTHIVVLLYNKLSPASSLSFIYQSQNAESYVSSENKLMNGESVETSETVIDEEACKAALRSSLKKWVEEKGFAQCNLSVDEVAEHLGTDRNYLRKYFRDNVHTDFRTWRSELRIEEAKKLLIAYPDYTITQIGEMVGFNHRSNFFTQFTKFAGITPKDWRKEHGITTE